MTGNKKLVVENAPRSPVSAFGDPPSTKTFEYDVFLSHSSKDIRKVEQIADRLEERGLEVWLSKRILKGGDHIFETIDHGLEVSRTLVLAISFSALKSDWVKLEGYTHRFRDPLNRERRFVPILLDECENDIPGSIKQYQYLDLRRLTQKSILELFNACNPESSKMK